MQIFCRECGKVLAEMDLPAVSSLEMNILKRATGGVFGIDLTPVFPVLDVIANPTPEGLAVQFNIRCPNGKHG